jgi:hypothetical protein
MLKKEYVKCESDGGKNYAATGAWIAPELYITQQGGCGS